MSTEAAASLGAGPTSGHSGVRPRAAFLLWRWDLTTARVIRYAVGVTFALGVAYAGQWPMYYLAPVLSASFLALPMPAPSLKQAIVMMTFIIAAFLVGLFYAFFLLPFPLVYLLLLPLGLFHIYYLANRRGPAFLVLMTLIAVLLLPLLSTTADALAAGVTVYFCLSAFVAVFTLLLAHAAVPDPVQHGPRPQRPGFAPGYSRPAAQRALKSTLVVAPLALVVLMTSADGAVLTLIFAAIYSMNPDLSAGKGAALASFAATVLGGLAGAACMMLLSAVPEFFFMMIIGCLFMLLFARLMFSSRPIAKFMPSAATTFIVLVSSSTADGANFFDNFVIRLGLILLTLLYIVVAVSILDELWPRLSPSAK